MSHKFLGISLITVLSLLFFFTNQGFYIRSVKRGYFGPVDFIWTLIKDLVLVFLIADTIMKL